MLYTFANEEELSAGLAAFLLKVSVPRFESEEKNNIVMCTQTPVFQAQNEAIARRNLFTLANSGGALPCALAKDLLNQGEDALKWDKW